MFFKYLLYAFFILFVCGCSNGQTDLQFEQKIFYQVVPKIIDSQFPDSQGSFMTQKIVGDSSIVWIEETSVNAIIGIMDSIYGFNQPFYHKYINKHISDKDLKFDTLNIGNGYKLDI